MNPAFSLQSERLLIRPWKSEDLENAIRLWGDPNVMTFIDARGGLSRDQVLKKLETEMGYQQEHGMQYWPIFEKESLDFVGCCGLKPWLHSPRGGYELGFHIIQEKWGRGYAIEAAQRVITFARESHFTHLMAGHHPGNVNSKKILSKLGFKYLEDVYFKPTGLMHPSYILTLDSK